MMIIMFPIILILITLQFGYDTSYTSWGSGSGNLGMPRQQFKVKAGKIKVNKVKLTSLK